MQFMFPVMIISLFICALWMLLVFKFPLSWLKSEDITSTIEFVGLVQHYISGHIIVSFYALSCKDFTVL
jgi:hypothetical protein